MSSTQVSIQGTEQGQRWEKRTDLKRLAEVVQVRQVLVTLGTGKVLHMLTAQSQKQLRALEEPT